jgi:hypothetical protein
MLACQEMLFAFSATCIVFKIIDDIKVDFDGLIKLKFLFSIDKDSDCIILMILILQEIFVENWNTIALLLKYLSKDRCNGIIWFFAFFNNFSFNYLSLSLLFFYLFAIFRCAVLIE